VPALRKGSLLLAPKQAMSLAKGHAVESRVALYLVAQGLRLLHRNFRCKQGEIDLIAEAGDQLVFVEVRFRQDNHYGSAPESVTRSKQRKMIQSAAFFLYRYPAYANHACRFDVVGVTLKDQQLDFDWIQHAFY
jgi:putative endonuclease